MPPLTPADFVALSVDAGRFLAFLVAFAGGFALLAYLFINWQPFF